MSCFLNSSFWWKLQGFSKFYHCYALLPTSSDIKFLTHLLKNNRGIIVSLSPIATKIELFGAAAVVEKQVL